MSQYLLLAHLKSLLLSRAMWPHVLLVKITMGKKKSVILTISKKVGYFNYDRCQTTSKISKSLTCIFKLLIHSNYFQQYKTTNNNSGCFVFMFIWEVTFIMSSSVANTKPFNIWTMLSLLEERLLYITYYLWTQNNPSSLYVT